MKPVRAKKKLGQHFLKEPKIAKKIADTLFYSSCDSALEIGPGMGILTQFLLQQNKELHLIEIDAESVTYLKEKYPHIANRIHEGDFLKFDLSSIFGNSPFAVIGNFPYNISSQIIFKLLECRNQIPFLSGMFQEEVARRICESPGTKRYGIISVLTQLYYDAEYLFSVSPKVFQPPPKVNSAVIQLHRKKDFILDCEEELLFKIVKLSFQQRRKMLRNSLKKINIEEHLLEGSIFDQRPETLSCEDFIKLTKQISNGTISNQQ